MPIAYRRAASFSREALSRLVALARLDKWAQLSPSWFGDLEEEIGYGSARAGISADEHSDEEAHDAPGSQRNAHNSSPDLRESQMMDHEYGTPRRQASSGTESMNSPLLVRRKSMLMDYDYPPPSPRPGTFQFSSSGAPMPPKSPLTGRMSFDIGEKRRTRSGSKHSGGDSEVLFENLELETGPGYLPLLIKRNHRPEENDFMTGAIDSPYENDMPLPPFTDEVIKRVKNLQDAAQRLPFKLFPKKLLMKIIYVDNQESWDKLPDLVYYTTSLGLQLAATELDKLKLVHGRDVTDDERMLALRAVGGTSRIELDYGKTVHVEDLHAILPREHRMYVAWYWDTLKEQGHIWDVIEPTVHGEKMDDIGEQKRKEDETKRREENPKSEESKQKPRFPQPAPSKSQAPRVDSHEKTSEPGMSKQTSRFSKPASSNYRSPHVESHDEESEPASQKPKRRFSEPVRWNFWTPDVESRNEDLESAKHRQKPQSSKPAASNYNAPRMEFDDAEAEL